MKEQQKDITASCQTDNLNFGNILNSKILPLLGRDRI